MRLFTLSMPLILMISLFGCSTVQVSQDYDTQADLSRYGSWQWRESIQPSTGDIRVDNSLLDRRIRAAVERHLAARKVHQTDKRPDLFLSYHLAIEQRIRGDTVHTTVGVGRYYHPWYGGIGTETHIRQYDVQRLTIDIHSVDSGDLIWRGVGTYRLKTYKTPQDAAVAMQSTVDKILVQFPPASKQ